MSRLSSKLVMMIKREPMISTKPRRSKLHMLFGISTGALSPRIELASDGFLLDLYCKAIEMGSTNALAYRQDAAKCEEFYVHSHPEVLAVLSDFTRVFQST